MRVVYSSTGTPRRSSVTFTDGLFFVHGSGGAAVGSVTVYRIAPDGYGTEIIEEMDYEYLNSETVVYTPQIGNMIGARPPQTLGSPSHIYSTSPSFKLDNSAPNSLIAAVSFPCVKVIITATLLDFIVNFSYNKRMKRGGRTRV